MRAITDISTPKKLVGTKRYATETTSTSSTRAIGTPNMPIIGMSTQDPKPELTRIVPRTTARSADLEGRPNLARNMGDVSGGEHRRVETVPALAQRHDGDMGLGGYRR
jgi:hypothetical protein